MALFNLKVEGVLQVPMLVEIDSLTGWDLIQKPLILNSFKFIKKPPLKLQFRPYFSVNTTFNNNLFDTELNERSKFSSKRMYLILFRFLFKH